MRGGREFFREGPRFGGGSLKISRQDPSFFNTPFMGHYISYSNARTHEIRGGTGGKYIFCHPHESGDPVFSITYGFPLFRQRRTSLWLARE